MKKTRKKTRKTAAATKKALTAEASPPAPPPVSLTPWNMVTRAQLALLLGVHPDTITDFAKQGMPVIARGGQGRESQYDAVECLAWWRERQGKNAKEAAQTRAYEASAKLNELKLAQQRGVLLARDQVVAEGQTFVKAWTAKVRALPRRARQAGIVSTPQLEAALAAICREVQDEISRWKTTADAIAAMKESDAA